MSKGITTISPMPKELENVCNNIFLGKIKRYMIGQRLVWLTDDQVKELEKWNKED